MARFMGFPITLVVVLFTTALVQSRDLEDSKITRIDSPTAWRKFLEKMSNTDLDFMHPESSEKQDSVINPKEENGSIESVESSQEIGDAKKNTTGVKGGLSGESDEALIHELFGAVNKDLANIFTVFAKNAANQQWWKGQNVCVDREEKVEKTNETESGQFNQFFTFGAAQFSSCRQSPTKYVCTTNTHKRGESKTVTVTYQCCHGFRRIDSKGQCTKVDLKPMIDLMKEVGGNDFMRMVKDTGMDSSIEAENVTVFVPNDDAVRQYENEMLATNNIRLRRRIEDNEVLTGNYKTDLTPADMILSHVIPEIIDTNEITNEEILYSENKNSTIRMNVYPGEKEPIITANCAEVKSANNPSMSGVAHVVSKVMKPVEKNLMELIREEPSLSMFSQMLENTNLSSVLSEHSHITVFAPNNAAFEKMESGLRNKYLRGEACIKSVLKHHLVPHTICSAAIVGRRRSTIDMNGEWLSLEKDDKGSLIIGEKALTENPDMMATNGVIHIVNKVVQPKSAQPMSSILTQSNHTTWLELLQKANLLDSIDQTINQTYFVPSEESLNEPETKEKLSKMDEKSLRDVIMYHSAQPKICSCEMSSDMTINSSLPGQQLQISVYNGLPLFNGLDHRATVQCAKIINTDEKGCETVAHEIDRLLLPPTQTILEYVKNNPNLTILNQILEGTNILSELNEGTVESFTLLAPSDESFKNVGSEEMKTLKEDKEMADLFLRKHMLEDHVCCSSIGPVVWPFVNEASNLAGTAMELRRDSAGRVHFSSAVATDCDKIFKDGVVHFINKPLLPRSLQVKDSNVKFTDPNGMQVLLFGI